MEETIEQNRKNYMSEFSLFNGDHYITFNILGFDTVRSEISAAVSNQGKISVCSFTLLNDKQNNSYFEYGVMCDKIYIHNFEQTEDAA